jgi:TPR repeat protein
MFKRNFCSYFACIACGVILLACAAEEPVISPREKLETLARNGDAVAMVQLGDEYCCGIGEGKNEERAIAWFCQAAREGNAEAQFTLGRIYQQSGMPLMAESRYSNVRVRKDNSIAYAWYKAAETKEHRLATKYLSLLKRTMNNPQMQEAETLALDPRAIPCQYQGQTLTPTPLPKGEGQ